MPTQNPDRPQEKLDPAMIHDLRSRLRGRLLESDHPAYKDARRIQNGLIDRHSALKSTLRGVHVDAAASTVRAAGGAT